VADYTIATGGIGKYELDLVADTESTVTFGGGVADPAVSNLGRVEVKCLSGTTPVYFKFGSSAATVKGDDCWDVHPGTSVVVEVGSSGDTVVRLISAEAAVVSVSNGG
jgi:hypothetical protein